MDFGAFFFVFDLYRVVQLNLTPEIEVFYMPFNRSLSILSRLGNRGDRVSDFSLQKLRFSALRGPN